MITKEQVQVFLKELNAFPSNGFARPLAEDWLKLRAELEQLKTRASNAEEQHAQWKKMATELGEELEAARREVSRLEQELKAEVCASEVALKIISKDRDKLKSALGAAVGDLRYYINNPSAWESYSQNVSDVIEQAVSKLKPFIDTESGEGL